MAKENNTTPEEHKSEWLQKEEELVGLMVLDSDGLKQSEFDLLKGKRKIACVPQP